MNRYYYTILIAACLISGCMHFPGYNPAMHGVNSHTDHNQKVFCPVSKEPVTITETTPSTVYKNRIYYFNGEAMKETFLQDPEKYIGDIPPVPEDPGLSATAILLGLLAGVGMLIMMTLRW